MKKQNPCEGCIYMGYAEGAHICEYILQTGHRRPCPAGAGCTEYINEEKKRVDFIMKKHWDENRARQLLAEGKADVEIAAAVGATLCAIQNWRRRLQLPANPLKPAPQENAVPDTAPGKPSLPECAKTTTNNDNAKPVRVAFDCFGCSVSLPAPNHQAAHQAIDALQGVVEQLRGMGGK